MRIANGTLYALMITEQRGIFRYSQRVLLHQFYWARSDVQRGKTKTNGWRLPMGYFSNRFQFRGPEGLWRDGKSSAGPWAYSGNLTGTIPNYGNLRYPPDVSPALQSRAVVGALSKLKAQKVNLAQAFGERAQTANLVASNLTAVAKAALALKRGNYLEALRMLGLRRTRHGYRFSGRDPTKNLAKRWLELQYGWKPLISDIYGALEELADTEKGNPYWMTVRDRKREVWFQTQEPEFNIGTLPCTIHATFARGCKVSLTYAPMNSMFRDLSSVGVLNPLSLAWELLPFSFMIDWAVPVGSYLDIADAGVGWDFLGGTMSDRREINVRYGAGKSPDGKSTFAGYGYYKHIMLDRTVLVQSPLPTTIAPKNPFSAPHVANAVALIRVAFKGVK